MAKSSATPKFSKVVVSSTRATNCLEIFRGYGIYSRKGVFLEAYADDFGCALGRLRMLNSHLSPSRKMRLVRVAAVVEKLGAKEFRELSRKAKKENQRRLKNEVQVSAEPERYRTSRS